MNCKRSILAAAVAAVGVMGVPTMATSQTIGAAQSFAIVGGQTVMMLLARRSPPSTETWACRRGRRSPVSAFAEHWRPSALTAMTAPHRVHRRLPTSYNTIVALGAGTALAPNSATR